MKESTRTKLTKFSRLWALSMALCIGLCVVGVFACMTDRKVLMGIATIGTILMFLIMLCQLVTSIIVRRWWCVVGALIGMAVSLSIWFFSIVALAAGQYRPPVREEPDDVSALIISTRQISAYRHSTPKPSEFHLFTKPLNL